MSDTDAAKQVSPVDLNAPVGTSPKALAISRALRSAARRAATRRDRRLADPSARKRFSRFVAGVISSFIVLVLLPSAASGVYFGFIASDQFVSESRFAVRNGSSSLAGLVAGL